MTDPSKGEYQQLRFHGFDAAKAYLIWLGRQIYLLLCWPKQFEREAETVSFAKPKWVKGLDSPAVFLLRFFPAIIGLSVLGTVIVTTICNARRVPFDAPTAWVAVGVGLLISLVVGTKFGVKYGVAFGIVVGSSLGITLGFVASVIVNTINHRTFPLERGVAVAAMDGMAAGALVGVAVNVSRDNARGLVVGLTAGLCFGVTIACAFALKSGLVSGLLWGALWGAVFGAAFGATFVVEGRAAFGLIGGLAIGVAFGITGVLAYGPTGGIQVGLVAACACWASYFRLTTYIPEFFLTIILYLVAATYPRKVRSAWTLCPASWNEVIWLPLPFVGEFLALIAQQDRAEGFRQIAFVAAERSLQRRAALAALEEIAVNDLRAQSLSQIANAAERLNWTTDAPAALPDELMTSLPRFDRAAQHVGQYLTLRSEFRKGEALQRAIEEIEALQRSLIAARGRTAPRLLQVANTWRQLIEAEQKSLAAQVAATREIPNPFVYGNPVREEQQEVFTGRRDIVDEIEQSILGAVQAPMLLLHGPRRMGKTSVLNQLPRLLGPDFAPAVIDCQNPAVRESRATLLRYLSRVMSAGLQRKRVAVEPLTEGQLAREPFAAFDDWLSSVEKAMPNRMRVLLCLDEYERLGSALQAGWGADFLDALRNTIQHRPRFVLMFTGAHTFAELGPAWTDRFISARRVRVSFLRRNEVIPLLTKPIPEFDLKYAAGALESLWDATCGQPFLTQAVAFELVQILNEQKRKEATSADVEKAIGRALVSGGEYFANVWSDAGEPGQAILCAVARNEMPPHFPAALRWLCEHDVLNTAGTFAVPMVELWVRQERI